MGRDDEESNANRSIYRGIVDKHVEKESTLDPERLYQNMVIKYTWKNYGISFKELMHESDIKEYFHFEEEMLMNQDYEIAQYEDSKPKE